MTDVYPPTHWAIRGTPPAYDTPDEDVYLTGRNVVLLAKAGTWCAQHGIGRIVLGPLAGNPFPDATPTFFAKMADALGTGLAHALEIVHSVPRAAQGGRDRARRSAWRPLRADIVVYESGAGPRQCYRGAATCTAAPAASVASGSMRLEGAGMADPAPYA